MKWQNELILTEIRKLVERKQFVAMNLLVLRQEGKHRKEDLRIPILIGLQKTNF